MGEQETEEEKVEVKRKAYVLILTSASKHETAGSQPSVMFSCQRVRRKDLYKNILSVFEISIIDLPGFRHGPIAWQDKFL